MSMFKELSKIDVSKHLSEKNGLSYLSWMAAWCIIKEHDPEADYKIHTTEEGYNYFSSELGAFVRVSLTIKGDTKTMDLPVMDYNNDSIQGTKKVKKVWPKVYVKALRKKLPMDELPEDHKDRKDVEWEEISNLTTRDVNDAIMRCLVKAAAMHGLGAQVYIDGEGHPLDLSKGLSKTKKAPAKSASKKSF